MDKELNLEFWARTTSNEVFYATLHPTRPVYAEQMEALGHGNRTFNLETDSAGNPIVHRIKSAYNDSHYGENTVPKMAMDIAGEGENEGEVGISSVGMITSW